MNEPWSILELLLTKMLVMVRLKAATIGISKQSLIIPMFSMFRFATQYHMKETILLITWENRV